MIQYIKFYSVVVLNRVDIILYFTYSVVVDEENQIKKTGNYVYYDEYSYCFVKLIMIAVDSIANPQLIKEKQKIYQKNNEEIKICDMFVEFKDEV